MSKTLEKEQNEEFNMSSENVKEYYTDLVKGDDKSVELIKIINRAFEQATKSEKTKEKKKKIETREIKEMRHTIRVCFKSVFHREPSLEMIEKIEYKLPENIKMNAFRWEWYDEEVVEMVRDWIKNFVSYTQKKK